MALLVFRREEIEVLSLINGKKINSFSVLGGMENFNKESFIDKKESHLTVINDFIKDGAIWKTKDGKFHLIRELQGVFNIINAPKRTIKIKTASKQPIGEHYYCSIGDVGVLFSIGKDEEFYTIAYPFNNDILSTWFRDEIIGDLGIEEKDDTNIECILSNDEFSVLSILIMNSKYIKSIGEDYLIANKLLDSEFLKFVDSNNILKLNTDAIRNIVFNNNLKEVVFSLEEKSILKTDEEKIVLNEILLNAFDTEYLREIVEISEITPFMRAKNLYVSNNGYLIIEPVLSKPLEWKIIVEGLNVTPHNLLSKLMEFSDITPSDEIRNEIIKRVKKM